MKIRITIITLILSALFISSSYALERKKMRDIQTDQLTTDAQATAPCKSSHMNLVWWIPHEFWTATIASERSVSEADKRKILGTLRPYSLLAICQADISSMGAFRFYGKTEIENKLIVSITGDDGRRYKAVPIKNIDPDLKNLLDAFKPILGNAMGNMGKNFHFYVLKGIDPNGSRLIDPYRKGVLDVKLAQRGGNMIKASIDLPLNALYVPRICPNGKEAHVSWVYCPWSGQKLPN